MRTTEIEIPTYDPSYATEFDYTRPFRLTLQEAGGLRVIMGEASDAGTPDVLIERGVGVWRVIVHPNEGDPICIIEIAENRVEVQDESGAVILASSLP